MRRAALVLTALIRPSSGTKSEMRGESVGKQGAAISRALEYVSETPFNPNIWPDALKHLGEATGSSFAQIAGWVSPGRLPMSVNWNEPEGMIKRWIELGGADPTVNPVIRMGMRTQELQTVTDAEFVSPEERKKLAIWGDFYEPYDLPHVCLTPLWRDRSADLMLVICRSARAGTIGPDERKAFDIIALRCREAAMLTQAIKDEGAHLLRGTLDALSVAAFALDGFGRVVALSERAERLLQDDALLRLKHGRLECIAARDTDKLNRAVSSCVLTGSPPPPPTCVVISNRGGVSATLRISQLPRERIDIGFGAIALVVVEKAEHPMLSPRMLVGLTLAEREVSLALLRGERAAQIARRRRVSIHTVRSQIKSIYAKAGVSGYVEYLAKVRLEK